MYILHIAVVQKVIFSFFLSFFFRSFTYNAPVLLQHVGISGCASLKNDALQHIASSPALTKGALRSIAAAQLGQDAARGFGPLLNAVASVAARCVYAQPFHLCYSI